MKLLFLVIICSLFFVGLSVPISWVGGSNGDWSNANNWLPAQVPGSGDIATLVGFTTVSVSQNVNAGTVITSGNSVVLTIINLSTFSVQQNFTQGGTLTIKTEAGSSFNTVGYFIFSGSTMTFQNFGSTNINPWVSGNVNQNTLSNTGTGNPVVFQGTAPNLIFANFYVPSGFQFSSTATQNFQSIVGNTLTLAYVETIGTSGWVFNNILLSPVTVNFLYGANFYGSVSVSNSSIGVARPTFNFAGTFTSYASVSLDVIPNFSSSFPVIFNGNFNLNFMNLGVTFNTPSIQGITTLNFGNTLGVPTIATVSTNCQLLNPNVNFQNQWTFSGQTLTWANAYTFNFNATLSGTAKFVFQQPVTFGSSALFIGFGQALTFTNGVVSNTPINFQTIAPLFTCTAPNYLFSVTGNQQLTFPAGLTVNGCTVTSSASMSVSIGVTTQNGNTTLPSNTIMSFTGDITFSGIGFPTNSLYSITLTGSITIPNNMYTASQVEVILPSSSALTVNNNGVITSNSGGFFSLNGGVTFGSGCSVSGLVAFPSGNVAVASSARVNWSGSILLRNTVLGGSADVWYSGNSITSTKGVSQITNGNFKLKGGLTLSYLWDGYLPNSGCQLIINTGGATGTRYVEGSVLANQNSSIVFDDLIYMNISTGSVNSAGLGSVTFRTSGQSLAFLNTYGTITLEKNIYLNHTNFHFQGIGKFSVSGNPTFYVQGGVNFPAAAGDAVVTVDGSLYVGVVANSTFGNTININSDLTTDDLDGNQYTAITKLTLSSSTSQTRTIQGNYVLGASLTFGGNIYVNTASNINSVGTIEIQGNNITLNNNANWQNPFLISGGSLTIFSTGSNVLTLGDQSPTHGLNIPGLITVNSPAQLTLNNLYSASFSVATSITGTGTLCVTNAYLSSNNAVTLSTYTVTLSNVSFTGTGAFTISPTDNNLNIATYVRAFTTTTYTGKTLAVNSATYATNLFLLSSNPVTITGSTLTFLPGSYSVNSVWLNNANIVFQGTTTIGSSGSFNGTGAITFNTSLVLTANTFITNTVTFGFNNGYIVTISSNNPVTLTLTGSQINVLGNVVTNQVSVVSTSNPFSYQFITGGGVIGSGWTWSNTVQLGKLNVTGARTLTFNLVLTNSLTTYFLNGITFNGGTFLPFSSTDNPTLGVETSFTTSVTTQLAPQITLNITGSSGFSFNGAATLTINGTVNCFSPLTFNSNVVFGYVTTTTSNPIYLRRGTTGWYPATASLSIYRNAINADANVTATIYPSLTFGMLSTAITGSNPGQLIFAGNFVVTGTSLSLSTNVYLGVISITSAQNNTLSGLNLLGALTLISTTTPWVEPVIILSSPQLTQTLILTGPARIANPSFGTNAQVLGPSRLAITDSLTVTSAFQFSAPVQLYVSTPSGSFNFNLNNNQSYLTFTSTPSLFNPLGYNLNTATNFVLTSTCKINILKFAVTTPLTIGNLNVNSGIIQFSSGSVNAQIVNVAGQASLWVDGTAFTSTQLLFSANNDLTNPSFFLFTISSANPTAVVTGTVVYKGIASAIVYNYNWPGQAIYVLNATASANGANSNFQMVIGNPGYTYYSTRSGASVTFTRSSNPTISPFPTQSNGPSPAVSSSSIVSINFILISISLLFFIFF